MQAARTHTPSLHARTRPAQQSQAHISGVLLVPGGCWRKQSAQQETTTHHDSDKDTAEESGPGRPPTSVTAREPKPVGGDEHQVSTWTGLRVGGTGPPPALTVVPQGPETPRVRISPFSSSPDPHAGNPAGRREGRGGPGAAEASLSLGAQKVL